MRAYHEPKPLSGLGIHRVRFGLFEVDHASGDVWKAGVRVRLLGRPFQVLASLLERPGAIVTRQELRQRLWAADTHVEFENGLNNAISRLRDALGDSADNPRFIETVPRRGYRFIAPVEGVAQNLLPAVRERRVTPRWMKAAVVLLAITGLAATYWALRPSPPALQSVAVLPFVTGGADGPASDEYLAFAITDALTTELSRVPALRVISQRSSLRYRHLDKRLPDIARELGVGSVVEGSLVREGDQVRVTVQLIDAERDTHLWAESYHVGSDEIVGTQSSLARRAANEIGAVLTGKPPAPAPPVRSTHPAVEELFLKGRYFMSLGTETGRQEAFSLFDEALALDADHAPLHAAIADFYILTDSMPTGVAMPRARAHAERALALDDTSADAHVTLGFLEYYGEWNWTDAEQQLRRALDLNPAHTRGRRWYGMYLAAMGRHDEAANEIERVLETDPVSLQALDSAAQVWFHGRRADRLLDAGQRLRALSPGSPQSHEHLAGAYVLRGDYAQALEAVREGLRVSDSDPLFVAIAAHVQGALGQRDAARALVHDLERRSEQGFVPPFLLAMGHIGAGDLQRALDALERGHATRDAYLVFLNASPWMDPLRGEPRFQAIVAQMNFPRR